MPLLSDLSRTLQDSAGESERSGPHPGEEKRERGRDCLGGRLTGASYLHAQVSSAEAFTPWVDTLPMALRQDKTAWEKR